MRRAATLAACGTMLAAGAVRAQCPDGTPPPCAVRPSHTAAPAPNSVAVLYFDNLSRDTADVFLADGLTEELITRLSQVRRLEIKSRFESLRYRGQRVTDPHALGRAVGAAYLVTGSLQQTPHPVRRDLAAIGG
jgi:TolB-like protein